MTLNNTKYLILLISLIPALSSCAQSSKKDNDFSPYLEEVRELQIPQWEHENWYVEDWTSQQSADQIIRNLYKADIFKYQTTDKDGQSVLIVGPNFYRLSGLDKRRVITLLDKSYQVTGTQNQGGFILKDWNTKKYIGVFDQEGLRLH